MRLITILIGVLFLFTCKEDIDIPVSINCNGSAELCDKKYSEVAFATTHNAFNYATGPTYFQGPNQDKPIINQLEFGIRAFMLDLYTPPGVGDEEIAIPWVYHSLSVLGFESLVKVLNPINDFLRENENEVVTLILESYVSAASVEFAIDSVGLDDLLYAYNGAWLTLQEMINSNQRLVILSDRADANGRDWYMYLWEHAVETDFDNKYQSDFSCDYNRGDADNDLFILNHFITSIDLGIGIEDSAQVINAMPYILDRAQECKSNTGKQPNFLTVDFYESGGVMDAVNALNGL
jgi:hypothetical protein